MNRITLERIDVKRGSRQLAVFLLLGSVINIAVAWSCAFWAAPSNDLEGWGSEVTRPNLLAAWVGQPEGFPDRSFESGTIYPRRAGIQKSNLMGWHEEIDYEDTEALMAGWPSFDLDLIEAGWPFASFEGGLWRRRDAWRTDFDLWKTKRSLLVNPGSFVDDDWTIIPLMPKWFGFLANAVFFGGILLLLFRWPRALRSCPPVQSPLASPDCAA